MKPRTMASRAAPAVLLAVSNGVHADPAPASPAPAGRTQFAAAANADQLRREQRRRETAHLHDGLYLRLGLGWGYLNTQSSFAGQSDARPAGDVIGDFSYIGDGPALDFAIGFTPAHGFVLGYAYAGQIAMSPRVTIETSRGEEEKDTNKYLASATHGAMIDIFPDPRGNIELGGMFGLASVSTGPDASSIGLAGALWAGYGAWIHDQVSLVALLRAGYMNTESGADSVGASPSRIQRNDSTFTLGVLLAMLIH